MGIKRDSNCPLCGARMSPTQWLDACTELVDPRLGVLGAHCPHCQGYLEMRPAAGRVDIGYLAGAGTRHFDVAFSIDLEGLAAEAAERPPSLVVTAPGRTWEFED